MRFIKAWRRRISGAILMAMLFMQLATAAYACAVAAPGPVQARPASAGDCHQQAAMPEQAHTPLCKAHCDKDAQSSLSPALGVQPPAADLAPLLRVLPPAQPQALPEAAPCHSAALVPPPGAPPLYLYFSVLRT